jgi:hypothetical protein
LPDFLVANNVKGQFFVNDITYRHGIDDRPYSPTKGHRFLVLVLANVTPPFVARNDELKSITLVDAKGRSVPARLISVAPLDRIRQTKPPVRGVRLVVQ